MFKNLWGHLVYFVSGIIIHAERQENIVLQDNLPLTIQSLCRKPYHTGDWPTNHYEGHPTEHAVGLPVIMLDTLLYRWPNNYYAGHPTVLYWWPTSNYAGHPTVQMTYQSLCRTPFCTDDLPTIMLDTLLYRWPTSHYAGRPNVQMT